jgi:hypothetical protein
MNWVSAVPAFLAELSFANAETLQAIQRATLVFHLRSILLNKKGLEVYR